MPSNGKTVLAVIPARGGSKGLPGKNLRPLGGLPLIGHSIELARRCPTIKRLIVSTDSPEIAEAASSLGATVPFLRPADLAQDQTPMWPVIRHAIEAVEKTETKRYDYLLLLDPTSPFRLPEDIDRAFAQLVASPDADGIVGVSEPEFNPIWHCVVSKDGFMADLFKEASTFTRRQDLPKVYRINASLFIWRADFVRRAARDWRSEGKHLLYEVPESRAIHIDTVEEFERAESMLKCGMIRVPWIEPEGKKK